MKRLLAPLVKTILNKLPVSSLRAFTVVLVPLPQNPIRRQARGFFYGQENNHDLQGEMVVHKTKSHKGRFIRSIACTTKLLLLTGLGNRTNLFEV